MWSPGSGGCRRRPAGWVSLWAPLASLPHAQLPLSCPGLRGVGGGSATDCRSRSPCFQPPDHGGSLLVAVDHCTRADFPDVGTLVAGHTLQPPVLDSLSAVPRSHAVFSPEQE